MRLMSFVIPCLMFFLDCLSGKLSVRNAGLSVCLASAILLHYPDSTESNILSFIWTLAVSAFGMLVFILVPDYLPAMCGLSALLYLIIRIRDHFKIPSRLFSGRSVWTSVEMYARCFRIILFLFATVLAAVFRDCPFVMSVAFAVLYSGFYIASYSGRTMFLSPAKEDKIKLMMSNRIWSPELDRSPDEVQFFYDRLKSTILSQKLYLDDNISITSLSMRLGTNRSYLSRIINLCYGGNFNRFINSFRIEYAMEMLGKDPRIRIWELAYMCGFHNQVSFTSAFRLFAGMSPKEYVREKHNFSSRPLSRTRES